MRILSLKMIFRGLLFIALLLGYGYSYVSAYQEIDLQKLGQKQSENKITQEASSSLLFCHPKMKVAFSAKPFPTKTREQILSFQQDPFLAMKNHEIKQIEVASFVSSVFTPSIDGIEPSIAAPPKAVLY
ncbi:MAG: hypothetical protein JNK65_07815 [Deltaproteobacteria bacterium]|nr:hypothetical protein [Deltaproteobacteria bacterium]